MTPVHRIALVLNDDFSMWHFFRGLLQILVRQGYQVFVVTPAGPFVPRLESLGLIHVALPLHRFVDPWGDLCYCARLAWFLRSRRIELVCNMTVKPIVYGGMAARLAGVPHVVGMVEGLGYTFAESQGVRDRFLRQLAKLLYRAGCALSDRVGFANPDDRAVFVQKGYLRSRHAIGFRSMVGVDVEANSPAVFTPDQLASKRRELGLSPDRVIVTMISRVVWSKGVREFVEASRAAAVWTPSPLFLLVGPRDKDAVDCVPADYLQAAAGRNFLWLEGFRTDTSEIVALSDVVTQPSFYREGVPRILLEALALAKPVVTTDHVGCRETVRDGWNGSLVPIHDTAAFTEAVRRLVLDPVLRHEWGNRSRGKAEEEFAEPKVIAGVIDRLFRL